MLFERTKLLFVNNNKKTGWKAKRSQGESASVVPDTWSTDTRIRCQKHDLPVEKGISEPNDSKGNLARNIICRCMKAVSETWSTGSWRRCQKLEVPAHEGGVRNLKYRLMKAVSETWSTGSWRRWRNMTYRWIKACYDAKVHKGGVRNTSCRCIKVCQK